jgi:hypothetical protein
VVGYIAIYDSLMLTALEMPHHTSVLGGSMYISNTTMFTSFAMPSVTVRLGYIQMHLNAALVSISVPLRTSVGRLITVDHNAMLTCLSVPYLTSVSVIPLTSVTMRC